jgi:hypothetical protein
MPDSGATLRRVRGLRPSLAAAGSLIAALVALVALLGPRLGFHAWPGGPGGRSERVATLSAPTPGAVKRAAAAPTPAAPRVRHLAARRAAARPIAAATPRRTRSAPRRTATSAPPARSPRPKPAPAPAATAAPAASAAATPAPTATPGPLESAVQTLRQTVPLPAPIQPAGDAAQQTAAAVDQLLPSR